MTSTTRSRKLIIAEWSSPTLEYENYNWHVSLYPDQAIVLVPRVKRVGNTRHYIEESHRITGDRHASLIQIADEEKEDGEDYTDRVRRVVYEDYHNF